MYSERSEKVSWSVIDVHLRGFCERRHKAWLGNVSYEQVRTTVQQALVNNDPHNGPVAFQAYGVFCMYQVGRPWWGAKSVLQEEIMFATHLRAQFLPFIDELEDRAKKLKCHGVVLGTSASDRDEVMCRALRPRGYNPVATELYKEMGAWAS